MLETGEGSFYRFDDFHGIGDADSVVDEDRIGDEVVFVHIPVPLEKEGIGFLTDENGIVAEYGIAYKVVAMMSFYGFCGNILYRFAGWAKDRQTHKDSYHDLIFHRKGEFACALTAVSARVFSIHFDGYFPVYVEGQNRL